MNILLMTRRFGVNLLTGDDASFDGGTAGNWTAEGTNTVAASTDDPRSGSHSLKCTYQDDVDLAVIDPFDYGVGGVFRASAWIKLPANWDGAAVGFESTGYTGGSFVSWYDVQASQKGAYVNAFLCFSVAAGDTVGKLSIKAFTSAPTAGRIVYVDDVAVRKVTL